jgi:predicted ribonuclease toxin of YeeF-YezG toxin-antitoxin module
MGEGGTRISQDPRFQRAKFRKGVRQKVFEDARGPDGKVRDPLTKRAIKFDDKWDMGHKPGVEHWKHQQSAAQRGLTREQFLDEYNKPTHYRPELPRSNRSHAGEAPNNTYLGD